MKFEGALRKTLVVSPVLNSMNLDCPAGPVPVHKELLSKSSLLSFAILDALMATVAQKLAVQEAGGDRSRTQYEPPRQQVFKTVEVSSSGLLGILLSIKIIRHFAFH